MCLIWTDCDARVGFVVQVNAWVSGSSKAFYAWNTKMIN